jgi:4-hydroxybenzoate polyprenyltransferase
MLSKIAGLFLVTRPLIILSVLFTPAATAFLAVDGIPPPLPTFFAAVVIVTATAAAHAFNDYRDRDIDALNVRTRSRPLVRKVLSPGAVLFFSLFLMAVSLLFSLLINAVCFLITLVGEFLIVVYSLKLKRTRTGFLLPALAAFILPPGAWAVYRPGHLFSLVPVIVGITGFCFELEPYWCQSILDIEGDRKRHAMTIPACYGVRFTAKVMLLMYSISFGLLVLLFFIAGLWYLYLSVTIILGTILLWYHVDFLKRFTPFRAKRLFILSMGYLIIVCSTIIVERFALSLYRFFLYWRSL